MTKSAWLVALGALAFAQPARAAAAGLAEPSPAQEPAPGTPAPVSPRAPDPNAKPTAKRPAVSVGGGAEFRHLYGIPVAGLDARAALGPADAFERHFWPAAFVGLLVGRTDAGLDVDHLVLGARFEGRAGFVYGGASAALGYFRVSRANGGFMDNAELSCDLFLGPQVPLGGHTALSLEARVTAEILPGTNDALAFGPGVALRLRFY
jgi:hypothetical protein